MAEAQPTDSAPARPFDTERLLRAVNRLQSRQDFESEPEFRAFLEGFKGRPLEEIRREAGSDGREEAVSLVACGVVGGAGVCENLGSFDMSIARTSLTRHGRPPE